MSRSSSEPSGWCSADVSETPLWPLGDDPNDWPTVSVVMPIRNEAENLERAVNAVLAQEYPRPFDVCLAVGPSDDETEAVADQLARMFARVLVVQNPAGTTPAGLNLAIRATTGEVVVRVDGHAGLNEGYIQHAVESLSVTRAVNVGGVQEAVGQTSFEQVVARAQRSRLGTGGPRYRVGGASGPVDTVYLGVFRRSCIEAVGLFDERLIRNQDYELNIRLRKAGGTIWFDPRLSVRYRPRSSLRTLARQYFEYGVWKAEVLRLHPESVRARQLAPVALLFFLSAAVVCAPRRPVALAVPGVYLLMISRTVIDGLKLRDGASSAFVLPTMHLSWGIGFTCRMLTSISRKLQMQQGMKCR